MGLVLDEPTDRDTIEEVGGFKFLLERDVAARLERYLPLQIDYDDLFWRAIRVKASRPTGCC